MLHQQMVQDGIFLDHNDLLPSDILSQLLRPVVAPRMLFSKESQNPPSHQILQIGCIINDAEINLYCLRGLHPVVFNQVVREVNSHWKVQGTLEQRAHFTLKMLQGAVLLKKQTLIRRFWQGSAWKPPVIPCKI
ncbi:hypothetical protein CISG_03884 [Coccidioides immitis RMSCC 3703]|uniref:Uncharacterized protein n=1 Tax=Coccidioides immitis RMSCC 3703 TaxID=454286 RepID=A0A0J8QN73_COCIT|nr:hypothetical protein CISG_03884 [Coccidioides immitis RMSCC 3703]